MKLLLLTPQLPYPPRQGTALRNWGLVRHLGRAHTVTVLSFAEPGQAVAEPLRAACARVVTVPLPRRTRADRLRGLLAPEPDLAQRLASAPMAQALSDLLAAERFDLVQVEGLELARYLPLAAGTPVLYDAHNAEYVLQRRAFATDLRQPRRWPRALYSALQWPRLKRFEARTVRAAWAVTCCSTEDAAALHALAPERARPVVVANGLDVAEYAAAEVAPAAPTVVFTGKMDYRPNVDAVTWFAEAIWPRVRARLPVAEWLIVGQQPAPAVRALHGRAGITVTGAVDDIRPYVARAAAYIAPLRMGGGTRLKLLEAMALARPIIATPIGAEGFAVRHDQELLLADAPAAFAEAVVRVLNDPALARRLGQAGLAFATAHYDWRVIIPALEHVLAGLNV